MTLLISAEKSCCACWTIGCFEARSAALPSAAGREDFLVGEAEGVPGMNLSFSVPAFCARITVFRMRSASALSRMGSIVAESVVWSSSVSPFSERCASSTCSEAVCWPLALARAVTKAS